MELLILLVQYDARHVLFVRIVPSPYSVRIPHKYVIPVALPSRRASPVLCGVHDAWVANGAAALAAEAHLATPAAYDN